jgi:hypothetical protein
MRKKIYAAGLRKLGSWNPGAGLPGNAEKRRIDDDADGKRDGRSYEQALVVVNEKLSRNISFHGGLLCFLLYRPENHCNTETAPTLNYFSYF